MHENAVRRKPDTRGGAANACQAGLIPAVVSVVEDKTVAEAISFLSIFAALVVLSVLSSVIIRLWREVTHPTTHTKPPHELWYRDKDGWDPVPNYVLTIFCRNDTEQVNRRAKGYCRNCKERIDGNRS